MELKYFKGMPQIFEGLERFYNFNKWNYLERDSLVGNCLRGR
jgi:hypothetical protein